MLVSCVVAVKIESQYGGSQKRMNAELGFSTPITPFTNFLAKALVLPYLAPLFVKLIMNLKSATDFFIRLSYSKYGIAEVTAAGPLVPSNL